MLTPRNIFVSILLFFILFSTNLFALSEAGNRAKYEIDNEWPPEARELFYRGIWNDKNINELIDFSENVEGIVDYMDYLIELDDFKCKRSTAKDSAGAALLCSLIVWVLIIGCIVLIVVKKKSKKKYTAIWSSRH